MKGKPNWQCATRFCGEEREVGDLCRYHAAHGGEVTVPKPKPQEIRTVVYPTGAARRGEQRPEVEMTDGQMRWWVAA